MPITEVRKDIDEIKARLAGLESGQVNRDIKLADVKKDLAEILGVVNAVKAILTAGGFLVSFIKWTAALMVAGGTIYAAFGAFRNDIFFFFGK